jgi:glycosyltransferase involved in cell wall biosynthesis
MRIAMIAGECPPLAVGGVGTHVGHLVQGLSEIVDGLDVYVYSDKLTEVSEIGNASIHFTSAGQPGSKLGAAQLHWIGESIARVVLQDYETKGLLPDIVHCHEWYAYEAARIISARLNIPIVSTVHLNVSASRMWGVSPHTLALREEGRMCRNSDAIIAVSHASGRRICDDHKTDPSKVWTVHNGALAPEARSSENFINRGSLLRRADLTASAEHLVIFAGRLSGQKGLPELLNSASVILSSHPDTVYVIAGEEGSSNSARAARSFVERNRLNANVRFLGKLSPHELYNWYQIADMAVVPSVYESFGYAALEPMLNGIAVIASDCGGLPEVVTDGVTGIVVPMNITPNGQQACSVRLLAEAQQRLLGSAVQRQQMGAAGLIQAKQRFSVSGMSSATKAIYQTVTTQCPVLQTRS